MDILTLSTFSARMHLLQPVSPGDLRYGSTDCYACTTVSSLHTLSSWALHSPSDSGKGCGVHKLTCVTHCCRRSADLVCTAGPPWAAVEVAADDGFL